MYSDAKGIFSLSFLLLKNYFIIILLRMLLAEFCPSLMYYGLSEPG